MVEVGLFFPSSKVSGRVPSHPTPRGQVDIGLLVVSSWFSHWKILAGSRSRRRRSRAPHHPSITTTQAPGCELVHNAPGGSWESMRRNENRSSFT